MAESKHKPRVYRTPQLSTSDRRALRNGHSYRQCGGGRQIIRKKPQGRNY